MKMVGSGQVEEVEKILQSNRHYIHDINYVTSLYHRSVSRTPIYTLANVDLTHLVCPPLWTEWRRVPESWRRLGCDRWRRAEACSRPTRVDVRRAARKRWDSNPRPTGNGSFRGTREGSAGTLASDDCSPRASSWCDDDGRARGWGRTLVPFSEC